MRLSELAHAITEQTNGEIPCFRWVIRDPEEVPLPHACIAKVGSGAGLYADDARFFATAKAQMYLAMRDDDDQERYEDIMDAALSRLKINYDYRIGYNRDEAIIVKIYDFEYRENEI